mgnify:CR=1 FL=1
MIEEYTVNNETVQDIEDFIYDSFNDYTKVFGGIEIYDNMEGGVVIEIYNNNLSADLYNAFYESGFEIIADKEY